MLQTCFFFVFLVTSTKAMHQGKMAECTFENELKGTVKIHFTGDKEVDTMFMGSITNLAEGKHGFHVHEKGDLGNQCKNAGGHFNPTKKNHGDLNAPENHEGDFGNIIANSSKIAKISITSKGTDLNQLIGKAIVVHEKEDDLGKGGAADSLTTGDAGARLDCCIIDWNEETKKMIGNSAASFTFSIILGVAVMIVHLLN
eukprot:GFUD01027565.1.p1 GENE.GFUD01027565.1~~GFUD01027565.1.p1  ORF type:complete len:200 (-),score=42.30 GFUD01027565.1:94-693(-)